MSVAPDCPARMACTCGQLTRATPLPFTTAKRPQRGNAPIRHRGVMCLQRHGEEAAAPAGCQVSRRQLMQVAAGLALLQAGPSRADPVDGVTTLVPSSIEIELSLYQKQVLEYNRRIQAQNNAPRGFPKFLREGFDIKVIGDDYQTSPEGVIYRDFEEGQGSLPVEGQQVVFNYTAYNESGARIDSSYQKGRPAETRLGINGLIPGFEMGLKTMRAGGKRRIIVPPELGPPVGPSTFFSAKQCEVFDVELLEIRTCTRRQNLMFSDVVCK